MRSPGEKKRPSNVSVVGRLGRRRPQGQAKREERGHGREVVEVIGGERLWHAGNDFLVLWDVRIVDS